MVSEPVDTVFAIDEPEIVPKNADETTLTFAETARVSPCYHDCNVDEELAQSHPLRKDAKQHEMKHDGGDDPQRHSENSLGREVHVVHILRPADAGVHQDLQRHVFAEYNVDRRWIALPLACLLSSSLRVLLFQSALVIW